MALLAASKLKLKAGDTEVTAAAGRQPRASVAGGADVAAAGGRQPRASVTGAPASAAGAADEGRPRR